MKLLSIGGTGFLGRHLTTLALDWGHEVTLFNRGHRQHPDWRELTQLHGDRDGDLAPLRGEGRHWDLVIDTCCYRPEQAEGLSDALLGRCDRLIFISTISVYRDFSQPGMDESAPLHEMAGSKKVIHMHGREGEVRCMTCGTIFPSDADLSIDLLIGRVAAVSSIQAPPKSP